MMCVFSIVNRKEKKSRGHFSYFITTLYRYSLFTGQTNIIGSDHTGMDFNQISVQHTLSIARRKLQRIMMYTLSDSKRFQSKFHWTKTKSLNLVIFLRYKTTNNKQ